MLRKVIFVCCLGLTSLCASAERSAKLHPDVKQIIHVWLNAQMDYQQIPYLSASFTQSQEIVWQGVFGKADITQSAKATDTAISSICSVTKVFTATAIMKLVDEGKLHLEQKVIDLLPLLSLQNDKLEDITIRSLLTHASGLPRDTVHAYWSGPEHDFPSEADFYESLSNQNRLSVAGSQILYSNIGYVLLGQIITKVSKKSYKDYIESEIFKPLNMNSSVVEMSQAQYGKAHVIGYSAINRNNTRQPASFYLTRAMQSAAGISSNAVDLAQFFKWQFSGVEADGSELMSPTSLAKMYKTDHVEFDNNRGLGFEIRTDQQGDTWAMHGGMCPGYNAFIKMNLSKKEGFAFVTSANRIRALAYINDLIEILGRGKLITQRKTEDVKLFEYTGYYDLNPFNSEYYIGKWGNGLVLLYLPVDSIKYAMYHYQKVDEDVFQLVDNGKLSSEKIQFNRNEKGDVVSVTNDGGLHHKLKEQPEHTLLTK